MKYNVYNINNCDFLGTIEFKKCLETMDVSDLKHKVILNKFEPLFKSYNEEIYNNRYENSEWFIFINSNTLKPALEINYYKDYEENEILIDTPESDTRATFFENLFEKHVDNMEYND